MTDESEDFLRFLIPPSILRTRIFIAARRVEWTVRIARGLRGGDGLSKFRAPARLKGGLAFIDARHAADEVFDAGVIAADVAFGDDRFAYLFSQAADVFESDADCLSHVTLARSAFS